MSGPWAQRLMALIDRDDVAAQRRVSQGRALLRAGRVTGVRVTSGTVSGRVQGKRATPLAVEVATGALTDEQWTSVVSALAGQVRHSARLLAGQVPAGLEGEMAAAGIALLPRGLQPACDCEDVAAVCAHAAAVWLALTELVASDPFMLLRLRGRGRERLLAEVAAARNRAASDLPPAGVALDEVDTARWTQAGPGLDEAELGLAPPPRTAAGPLRLLGEPPGWAGGVSPGDLLAPLVVQAGEWARALAEGDDPAS